MSAPLALTLVPAAVVVAVPVDVLARPSEASLDGSRVDTSHAEESRVRIFKVEVDTDKPLPGAIFKAWTDLNHNGRPDVGEHPARLVTDSRGLSDWYTAPVSARVCVKELKAPNGYLPKKATICREAPATPGAGARITVTNSTSPYEQRIPLVVTKTTDSSDPGDVAGIVGATIEVHQDSTTGPLLATHTFTTGDISAGVGTWASDPVFDQNHDYFVVVTNDPSGFVPAQAAVTATLDVSHSGAPIQLDADLVDGKIWTSLLAARISDPTVSPGENLFDTVTISSTGGHTIPSSWTLLGGVTPATGGTCTGLDWSAAPVVASGRFTVGGDGTYRVGHLRVPSVGCYTYSVSAEPTTFTTPATTIPGVRAQTVLSRSRPKLRTQVNHPRTAAAAVLADRVTVTGGYGAPITGAWRLYGPIAPNRAGSCRAISWVAAPVAAAGTFALPRKGTATVGRHRLPHAGEGCYTYSERLNGTSVTKAVGWTRPGRRAETSAVRPGKPHVPRRPEVQSGFDGVAAATKQATATSTVAMPAIGLRAFADPVRFQGRNLFPPADVSAAGRWAGGARLDALAGTTVPVGHVSDRHDRPGAFWPLNRAAVSELVVTRTGGNRQLWRVKRVRVTPRDRLPRSIFAQSMRRRLVLVTRTNEVHYADGRFHYLSNRIVIAAPVR